MLAGVPGLPAAVGADDRAAESAEEHPEGRVVLHLRNHQAHPRRPSPCRQQLLVSLNTLCWSIH